MEDDDVVMDGQADRLTNRYSYSCKQDRQKIRTVNAKKYTKKRTLYCLEREKKHTLLKTQKMSISTEDKIEHKRRMQNEYIKKKNI